MTTGGVFDSVLLALLSLVIGGLLVSLVIGGVSRRRARLLKLAEAHLLPRLAPVDLGSAIPRAIRLGLVGLLAGLALAGPRWGEEATAMRGEGVDVVLALDASLSMLATDERPNRLERMKQEVRRYRDLSRGDRVALLAFAGRSYILTPLTVDDGAIELFLDNLDPSIVGQAGSSLARTITQGTDLLLATKTASDRALVLMSDGEAFESPEEIALATQRAKENGVYLVTVGFGTTEGSTIPVGTEDKPELKRDEHGEVVVTRYNPETLRTAAEGAGGTFIDAGATDKAARIRGALQGLRSAPRAMAGGTSRTPRFQWFLIPALLLLGLDT
ncbi:MAG: VWA domain-containing protein, partial [Cytophagaceae bacterium]|nr:VWA domain-containing protein [Gemmatimonadaceae bacterium]